MITGLPEPQGEQLMRPNLACAVSTMFHVVERGRWNQGGFTICDRGEKLAVGCASVQLLAFRQPGHHQSPRAVDA
jgi:hypothetical protein